MVGLTATPVFTRDCTGCGACLLTCPTHAIRPVSGRVPVVLRASAPLCTGCGECVEVCPADAVRLPGHPDPVTPASTVSQPLHEPAVPVGSAGSVSWLSREPVVPAGPASAVSQPPHGPADPAGSVSRPYGEPAASASVVIPASAAARRVASTEEDRCQKL